MQGKRKSPEIFILTYHPYSYEPHAPQPQASPLTPRLLGGSDLEESDSATLALSGYLGLPPFMEGLQRVPGIFLLAGH